MHLGRYQLLAQRGAGRDGISYRAQAADTARPVEIRVLSGAALEADRWKPLSKKLRLAAMLEQPAALGIHELRLEHDPPYVVLEWLQGRSLAEGGQGQPPLPPSDVERFARELGPVLVAAHRLGLAHGLLCPATVWLTEGGQAKLDFTGVDVGTTVERGLASTLDASCCPPEQLGAATPDPAGDIYALGALLWWLLTGRAWEGEAKPASPPLAPALAAPWVDLLPRMLARDPSERPSAREVFSSLDLAQVTLTMADAAKSAVGTQSLLDPSPPVLAPPRREETRLGRFRLREKLGEGGLSVVYRAEDVTDGTVVAIKMLHMRWDSHEPALQRLRKEARLLAEVRNPYVANLLELNEEEDIPYLVLEFVAGKSLAQLLVQRRQWDEPTVLKIMADVARALVDAHKRGIVHRDIKPSNIMMVEDSQPDGIGVKLIDFGVARHVVQSASLHLTKEGTPVGTVQYMAPEQATGTGPVDARTDVYAMGATLFHLLAGRPPFEAETPLAMSILQAGVPVPSVQRLNPAVSEGVSRLIEKALSRNPDARYADAEDLLRDLERMLRGEPSTIIVHPRLPDCPPNKILHFDWTWDLDAAPEQLWPYVSNTERLNRAVGLPPVQFTSEADPAGGVRRFGEFRKAGFVNTWREHPFEWIEGQRMGVLREYSQGVFKWLMTSTELSPRLGGGTTLWRNEVRIESRGLIGRMVAAVEVGIRGRRSVERVYRRIDAFVTGKLGRAAAVDAFEEPTALSGARRRRLEELLSQLIGSQVEPAVALQLGDYLLQAPVQEVARIRPLALARRLGRDPDQVVAACLLGARVGLLVLLWDILCPLCRIPSAIKETLRELGKHGHCEACNLDFELDFAQSVELIFRVHPEIRPSELGIYCIGGPVHSPHVAAQVYVGAGERLDLDLRLPEGAYRLRGPQLPYSLDFRVEPAAATVRWDIPLAHHPDRQGNAHSPGPRLKSGRQMLALANDSAQPLIVRIERTAARDDALTAARASSLALFRELFPSEVLSPGQLASMAAVTLLVTDLDQASNLDQADNLYASLGDARAFSVLHSYFRVVDDGVRREGGALVKTVGDGALAAFSEPVAAVRAGLELQAQRWWGTPAPGPAGPDAGKEPTVLLRLRVGIHRGPALAATINDHLDYFGTTVNQALQLPRLMQGGDLVVSQAVAHDPQVIGLLQKRGLISEVLDASLPGQVDSPLHRLVRPATGSP